MIKFIGGEIYKKIYGEWHQLSQCGFLWRKCDSATKWVLEGWGVKP